MKTKLSEIEKLRLEKAKLIGECSQYEEQLLHKWKYTKNNFGHLLVNTFFSSAKSGFAELLGPLFGSSKQQMSKEPEKSSSGVAQMFIAASPVIWEIVQPLLIGFVLKKVKSIFKRKKKKNLS